MAGTGASSTPSPYRVGVPIVGTHSRSEYDKELWDDLANVIYYAESTAIVNANTDGFFCSMDIPCPVKCRLEITAQAYADSDADWSGFIQIDGVDNHTTQPTVENNSTSILVSWFRCPDVEPGTHTVRIRVRPNITVGFYNVQLKVRRGRIPPS